MGVRSRLRVPVLALIAVLTAALALPALADDIVDLYPETAPPSAETGEANNDTPSLWFVQLGNKPLADGGTLSATTSDKQAFRANAARAGLAYTERFAFDTLWNGLSISVAPGDLAKLARIAGVTGLWPVETAALPATSEVPDLSTALAMTGADVAQTELGYDGTGIRVAVMDTGVDYDHPDLGGCFGAGCRVVTGFDLVGDAFNADSTSPSFNPIPVPDPDPDDCNGHGTHVAGIVGASGDPSAGGARGVAPGVTFGAYRVFGCEGSTTADIMIAAMERVLADGMHVLNMSIGSAFQWPNYPTAQASDRLVNAGVVVVASIGNSGANGVYSAGAPGLGEKVIGVASFDNSHVALTTFTVSPAGLTIGYGNAAAAPAAPTSGSLPLAKTGSPTVGNDGCAAHAPGAFAGKAVLIRRGTCTFHQKALNAQNAGAAAVVLYNNLAGRFSPTVAGSPAITIPVVAVSDAEGVAINNAINSGPQTLTWTDQTGTFANPTGGLISSFSSFGLSPDLALKPDIGAPGGLIRSTVPLEQGGYATISGTSMSSPHVAGSVALLLQARPATPSQAVRGILQNSADPKNWFGNPGLGFLDNVHRQGAGMLDIPGAILSTTKIQPGKLSLGESQAGPATRTLSLENTGTSDVTYTLSHVPALSTRGSTFSPIFTTGFASAAFSAASVTVPAGGTGSVDVTITANPALADRSQYGGYIVLTASTGETYRIPYAGFKGDYQSIQALTPGGAANFPRIARRTATGSFLLQGDGAVFTMTGNDVPFVLVHLDHQVRKLRAEVIETASGRNVGRAFDFWYVGRSSTSTSFFAIPFDGVTVTGGRTTTVPDGTYVITVSVQKALGSDEDPADWEAVTTTTLVIDRP